MIKLPKVIVTSVIRSAHQGQSHGGVYIVDLADGQFEQVLDWNDESISWEGRGGDRGLRGIAFYHDHIYIAASNEIFIYDKTFTLIGSFTNRYLKHCHEIDINENNLYLTSTGFDSILVYDLKKNIFTHGYCIRLGAIGKRLSRRFKICLRPQLQGFDPNSKNGPEEYDSIHINNVFCYNGSIFAAGKGFGRLMEINNDTLKVYAKIPYGTHNARPFNGGVLLSNTGSDKVEQLHVDGSLLKEYPVIRYNEAELEHMGLPEDHARQGFARGLCLFRDDLVVVGSSPATITAYCMGKPQPVKIVNLSRDVRNAIHGLAVWPF